jgi:hypothetical protein
MPQIEVDTNAREILVLWKDLFGAKAGASIDYSEAVRCAQFVVLKYLKAQKPARRR